LLGEHARGLFQSHARLLNGQVGVHHLAHAVGQGLQFGLGEGRAALRAAIIAAGIDRVIHLDWHTREQLAGHRHHEERERTTIDAHPVFGSHGDGGHSGIG
jgi:hypothetical protein